MVISRLCDNSEAILRARYYLNENEDWPVLCHRVTDSVIPISCSRYDYTEEEVRELTRRMFEHINNLEFLPNSPTMFNAGTEYPMLSACFVIDVPDNLPGIYESVKESAMIHKMGGGVGFSLSKLRCRGSKIATTHGNSGGAVSFLKVFANGTAEITAAGKRKGANMAMLRIDHADIEEFINCKSVEGELANFNISLQFTDSFLSACLNDTEISLIDPKDGSVVRVVQARSLMRKAAEGAWNNGEPGACYIDAVNRDNPTPHLGEINSSNPCGEYYSSPSYNSCTLGSINLTRYVMVKNIESSIVFDWEKFRKDIFDYVFYLDCIIDANSFPLEKIKEVTCKTRPIGLGVMGFADILIMMGIKYNSEEGLSFARELSENLSYYSLVASKELAKKRGHYAEFRVENHGYEKARGLGVLDWEALVKEIKIHGLRNSHTVVIAPTGTIARIANECSFGIEPIFSKSFESNILDGAKQETKNGLYQKFLDGELKVGEDVFVCAKDISWQDHIKMQAEWQKFVHNGISKTIGMPNSATTQDVYAAYMMAYELGLKGITVYREGSRKQEVLVEKSKKEEWHGVGDTFEHASPIKRPLELECDIHHTQVGGEKWVVLVGLLDGKPYEIFGGLQKFIELPRKYTKGLIVKKPNKKSRSKYDLILDKGTPDELVVKDIVSVFENKEHGVVGRLISLSLRHQARPSFLCEQLIKDDDFDFQTYSKVIARILKRYIVDGENPESSKVCPECGGELYYMEGCVLCHSCAWSKCS